MGLTNAEKQAAWRARQAENKQRVAELEAEVERLKASPADDDRPGLLGDDMYVFQRWADWFETQVIEGRLAPKTLGLLAPQLVWLATVYHGPDGKRGARKRKSSAEQQAIWQRKKQRKAG